MRNASKLSRTKRVMEKSILKMENSTAESNETNRLLASLAKETSRDSIALKALTLIATVYLPATLCAVSFSQPA